MVKKASDMSPLRRKQLREKLDTDRDVLRTHVRAVAQGYTTAFFCWGPGGLGKTHIITQELDDIVGNAWQHHTAYSTPKALFESLAGAPTAIHLFEDCERLYKQDIGASILRAACGSPRDAERWITYETASETRRLRFSGGIIIVSNEDIRKGKGPLQAVASRFRPMEWNLTTEERIAAIMDMAEAGSRRAGRILSAKQCREVAAYLVDEMALSAGACSVDFRTFHEHALPSFCQWLDDPSGPHWHDVLSSKLQGEVCMPESREEKTAKLEELAWVIYHNGALKGNPAKLKAWVDATGLKKSQYYVHLKAAHAKWGRKPQANAAGSALIPAKP